MNYFLSSNYKNILTFMISTCILYLTGTGIILDYIDFSDPLGELAVFMISAMAAILSLSALTFKK